MTEDSAADALREKVAEAALSARWPDGSVVTALSGRTAPMVADAVLAALNLPALLAVERERVLREALDPACLQCGEKRSRVRAESLFCCTISGYETPEVDQEWERHRWADWSDRELDRAGIKPDAYDKHRRTQATVLEWVDCDDTKRGHLPGDEEAVGGMWIERVGQCMACGHHVSTPTTPNAEEESRG